MKPVRERGRERDDKEAKWISSYPVRELMFPGLVRAIFLLCSGRSLGVPQIACLSTCSGQR